MHGICRLIFLSALLSAPPLSWAVQPSGQIAPPPASVDTSGIVERGGTINIVNSTQKNLVIDGVSYLLPATPVTLHDAVGKPLSKNFVLKAGMQIRFNTSKKAGAAKDEIREIWVTRLDGKPTRP